MAMRDFRIGVSDDVLDDLQRRLETVRWPSVTDPESWREGAAFAEVGDLINHWRDGFDWHAQEERLNRLPQFVADIDGMDIHFVHQHGVGPDPLPLVLTHGWPGTFAEFERMLPLLTDPGAHGGDPADAFHVVAPSLPGFGFSGAPQGPAMSSKAIAIVWRRLMHVLGYDRFAAQGGDIGAGVSMWLARQFPGEIRGIHLNYVPASFTPAEDPHAQLSADEIDYLGRAATFASEEGAYAALQATKPQTLAFALSDSPVGLASWIAEKFYAWTDRSTGSKITRDALLTDISIHWFSGNLAASLGIYKANRSEPLAFMIGEKVNVPVAVAAFPHELPMPPRERLERVFPVTRWTQMPSGGHFAAMEEPELLAQDIRAFFRPLR